MKMGEQLSRQDDFVVKDSPVIMGVLLGFCVAFGIAFAYFVNPVEAGAIYWTILGCMLVFACVFVFRLVVGKLHLLINRKGIYFYRTGLFLRWKNIVGARYVNIKEEEDDEDFRLFIHYRDKQTNEIKLATFKTNLIMNKSDGEIEEAIAFYRSANSQS